MTEGLWSSSAAADMVHSYARGVLLIPQCWMCLAAAYVLWYIECGIWYTTRLRRQMRDLTADVEAGIEVAQHRMDWFETRQFKRVPWELLDEWDEGQAA